MRRLLNTVYITNELSYLTLDGENLVCKIENKEHLRVPFDNIENIVCFNYLGCSPALMGKCVSKGIPINFVSPQGHFLAKVCGETKGNVFLRVQQIDMFREHGLELAKNGVAAKCCSSVKLIKGFMHNNADLREDPGILNVVRELTEAAEEVYACDSFDSVMGVEGYSASCYFYIFGRFLTNPNNNFTFEYRNKRPPLDPVNAVLSFVYTLLTNEIGSALETVGLDSYIGFFHTLRSGRKSLACDLVEEQRCLADRFVLRMFNLRILSPDDFENQISGAVYLNDDGRRKVLKNWQERKREDFIHPYLKKKIAFGLIPYVQANLLAKFVRGDIKEYPCFLLK